MGVRILHLIATVIDACGQSGKWRRGHPDLILNPIVSARPPTATRTSGECLCTLEGDGVHHRRNGHHRAGPRRQDCIRFAVGGFRIE